MAPIYHDLDLSGLFANMAFPCCICITSSFFLPPSLTLESCFWCKPCLCPRFRARGMKYLKRINIYTFWYRVEGVKQIYSHSLLVLVLQIYSIPRSSCHVDIFGHFQSVSIAFHGFLLSATFSIKNDHDDAVPFLEYNWLCRLLSYNSRRVLSSGINVLVFLDRLKVIFRFILPQNSGFLKTYM